jgi:hypothetical protein
MESIITALITGGLALIGVIISNNASNKRMEQQLMTAQAVTDTKIEQLTDEVRKHNTFGDRITRLETKVETLEGRIAG